MNPQKPPSIRDIAQMAGVSIATVSRVINGTARVAEPTRQRVQAIIDECGYVTNMAAKSLREARTKTIGMIVPDISNDFFSTLAFHTEQALAQKGYSVFVCNTANDPEREQDYLKTLASKRVDGILCISGLGDFKTATVPTTIPLVCIDRRPDAHRDAPHVISDNVRGGYLATERLISRGCRRIMIVSNVIKDDGRIDREKGYRQALEAADIEFDPSLVIRLHGGRPSVDEADELVQAFLRAGNTVDGIFAASDHAAVGALKALKTLGISVPKEVKLIGFDDSAYVRLTSPSISSIHRYPKTMAETGCSTLLSLIAGEEVPLETRITVSLVERESSAA